MSSQYKIKIAQIDPNGLCNAKCWFCPVAYVPNPEFAKKHMPIETFENILIQLCDGKGDFVEESFDFIYTAHYNEVLLYKYFEEMLQLFRKYSFKTIILTNGIALTKSKVEIIKNYPDVIYGVCLNIPSSDPEQWAKLNKSNPAIFNKIIENILYLKEISENKIEISVQVNTIDNNLSFSQPLELAPKFSDTNATDELENMKKILPGINCYTNLHLVDRAGYLENFNVLTNKQFISNQSQGKKVIGCSNSFGPGGRPNEWIHINANGDLFICCNDYDFDTIFGNINDKNIKEIWDSKERQLAIINAYESICTTCSAAVWG